uniref:Uncharacterized protein n=1 Tax=Populus trichocarpa TaxID=3694 RepID=A0A2K1Z533_POPTR
MFFLSAWIENFSGGNRETALEKSLSPSSNPSKPIVLARNPKVNKLQVPVHDHTTEQIQNPCRLNLQHLFYRGWEASISCLESMRFELKCHEEAGAKSSPVFMK